MFSKEKIEEAINNAAEHLSVLDDEIEKAYDAGYDDEAHMLEAVWSVVNAEYKQYVKLYWKSV